MGLAGRGRCSSRRECSRPFGYFRWPIDQLAVVDRNVLRIAIFEFEIAQITPMRVAINEAVELAKEFGADSAPRFVNGVLGAIASAPDASTEHVEAAKK